MKKITKKTIKKTTPSPKKKKGVSTKPSPVLKSKKARAKKGAETALQKNAKKASKVVAKKPSKPPTPKAGTKKTAQNKPKKLVPSPTAKKGSQKTLAGKKHTLKPKTDPNTMATTSMVVVGKTPPPLDAQKKPRAKKAEKTDTESAKPSKLSSTAKKELKLLRDNEKKWEIFYKKSRDIKPLTFRVSGQFLPKTPLEHPLFGWGWVISNKNHRLEVLFKDKVRWLLSNYSSGLKSSSKKTKSSSKVRGTL